MNHLRSLSSLTLRSTQNFTASRKLTSNFAKLNHSNLICFQTRFFTTNGNGESVKNETFSKIPKMTQEDIVEELEEEEEDAPVYVNPETGEVGGRNGPEPTRYGDWEKKGRVSDF